jgi:hypothetical protein
MSHAETLLKLDIDCHALLTQQAALLVIGDQANALCDMLSQNPAVTHQPGPVRLHFGLPFFTSPVPILISHLISEGGATLDQLSLFGWFEENFMLHPRAEVYGTTPMGDSPLLFARDIDPDRPVEIWFRVPTSGAWDRAIGLAIASTAYADPQTLTGDDAALIALEHALPDRGGELVAALRMDVARGASLRSVLRARRKTLDPALMSRLDGMRVLCNAIRVLRLSPAGSNTGDIAALLR